jgi:tetratricopeptide (TPR) repeat protein
MKKILFLLSLFIFFNFISFSQDNTADNTSVPVADNGWSYYTKGDYNNSIRILLEEKKLYPDRINVYVILAWDYRELKQYYNMEKISEDGLKIKPNDIRIIKNLGEALFFQGKFKEAATAFEKYIKYKYSLADTNLGIIYYYIGYSYLQLKAYNKADIAFCMATQLPHPNKLNNFLFLAEINEQLKKYQKSKVYYEKVLVMNAGNPEAIQGLERIKQYNSNN